MKVTTIGVFVVWLLAGIGWCVNLVGTVMMALAMTAWSDITPMLVTKIIGVFFVPLGAILGWFGIFT